MASSGASRVRSGASFGTFGGSVVLLVKSGIFSEASGAGLGTIVRWANSCEVVRRNRWRSC
jgi:hypothetical protein